MAESVVSFAVQTIGNLLAEEARFLHGVKDQVEELQSELIRLQRFLKNADSKKAKDEQIHEWILEVKDTAYDAEDLVEKYAFRVGSWRGGGLVQFLNRCVCVLSDLHLRHKVGSEIQALNTKILRLKNDFQTYGIPAITEREDSSSVQQVFRRTYSFVDEEAFVELENDVDLLVERLVDDFVGVVSITGLGDLGKTTIARKVYKHRSVKRHFDGLVWICVSQQWQAKEMLQQILIKLAPGKEQDIRNQWTEDELKRELFKIQQQMKCLIVLDDIWKTDAWDCIKAAFPSGHNGSKILLTTRNKDVAMYIGPNGYHHEPRFLEDDECWELLQRKALRTRHDQGHDMNELAILGKKMVKHCGGLPLAVIALGGILSTKNGFSEWETVHKNIKPNLWNRNIFGEAKGGLEKILGLSYHDLPFMLKPCFLYVRTEDAEMNANTIYQLWMAEGLVLQDRGSKESIMELAEVYLGELGQRGMVQLQTSDLLGLRRRIKSCRLHDLMRDLCLLEAERENFVFSDHFYIYSKSDVNCSPN